MGVFDMFEAVVKIFIAIFVPKKKRSRAKRFLLGGFWNLIRIKKKALSVGRDLTVGKDEITVNKNTTIGDNCSFNGLRIFGNGRVTIGNSVVIATDAVILSGNHNYEGEEIPFDNGYNPRPVTIGDFVWIGVRVTILPGTTIGEGAIIQAGSVVRGEIPPYSIAGGNPAKVFKTRDIERFKRLKAEGKIHSFK